MKKIERRTSIRKLGAAVTLAPGLHPVDRRRGRGQA